MRLRLAVVEPTEDPVLDAGDAVTRKVVLPEDRARRLEELTGGWDALGALDGMRVFIAQRAKLELRIGALGLRPAVEESTRLNSLLVRGLTESQQLHLVSDERLLSQVGWPIRLLHGTVVTRSGWSGGETEHRFVVSYRFFEHSGEALLQVGDETLLRDHRDDLLALLRSGWPLWTPSTGVAVLSELWQ